MSTTKEKTLLVLSETIRGSLDLVDQETKTHSLVPVVGLESLGLQGLATYGAPLWATDVDKDGNLVKTKVIGAVGFIKPSALEKLRVTTQEQ